MDCVEVNPLIYHGHSIISSRTYNPRIHLNTGLLRISVQNKIYDIRNKMLQASDGKI